MKNCDVRKNVIDFATIVLKKLLIKCSMTLFSIFSRDTEILKKIYDSKKIKINIYESFMIQMKSIFQKTKNQIFY